MSKRSEEKIVGINQQSWKQKLASYKRHPGSFVIMLLTVLAAVITAGVLLSLIIYIVAKGVPNIRPAMFAWKYTTENCSMTPAILNTLLMTLLTLVIAVPIGVSSAIYLVEYSNRGSKFQMTLVKIIRMTTETLQGIPSIVFGLFGFLAFVVACKFSYSLLGGAITMALMVLPLIMRTTEEALLSVPDSFREGSFGLGAGRLRTIFRIILPSAVPGILAGVILAIGRIVGETAALMYTAGTSTDVCTGLFKPCRTLAVHMYQLLCEGKYMDAAYATAVVLLVLVILINALSSSAAKKLTKR